MADFDDDQPQPNDSHRGEPGDAPSARRFSRPKGRSRRNAAEGDTGRAARPRSSSRARAKSRRPGGRTARGGNDGGWLQNPRARLGLAIVLAVVLALVILLVVRDCQRNRLESSYSNYITTVAQIVQTSADQGRELREVMSNTEALDPPKLSARIAQLGTKAQGLVTQAEGLTPPDKLKQANNSLVTLLQYRVTGLSNLAANMPTLLKAEDADFTAGGIAQQMQRFLASDVIYEDSFAAPARQAMADDKITGVEVPQLQRFLPNDTLATTEGAATLLPGLRRTSTGSTNGTDQPTDGNLRGTSLVQTEALPSETPLSKDGPTTIEASENLKWRVTVNNGGHFVENNVVVTATFSYPDQPNDAQVQEATIPVIEPKQEVTVEIPGPTNIDYRQQGNLLIEITPVPGETITENNREEYAVKIAL